MPRKQVDAHNLPVTGGPNPKLPGSVLFRHGLIELVVGTLPLLAVATATQWLLDLPNTYLVRVFALYALLAWMILWFVPSNLSGHGLGLANRITLARGILLLPVAALVAEWRIFTDIGYWWIVGVSTIAMLLDGLDGWVARRTGTSTKFGSP